MVFGDWFGEFCFWGFCVFLIVAWALVQIISDAAKAAKHVVQNETVQEVGKGFLARWVGDLLVRK